MSNKFKIEGFNEDEKDFLNAYKRRKKSSDDAEAFENKMWLFLHSLEKYNKLNITREAKVQFKSSGNWKERKVDIVAECDMTRLFIECTIDKKQDAKVHSTINKFKEYQRFISLNNKNTRQIYFTNQKISPELHQSLIEANIFYLSEIAVDYFIKIIKEYKELTYYQFLNFIFGPHGKKEGQIVRALDKNDYLLPVLKRKDKLGNYYIFSVTPKTLLPISTVPHREMSSFDSNISNSYQRLIKRKKINGIKKYIKNDGSFPTNLIVNLNKKGKFQQLPKMEGNNKSFGTLELTPRFGMFNIVDGQHRLYSYIGEENAKIHYLTITSYEGLSIKNQIETFVSINEKQTPVSADLIWDLYPELYTVNDKLEGYKVKISKLVKKLNNDKKSVFYHKIKYPSAPYGSKSASNINLNSFCNTLKSLNLIGDGKIEGKLILKLGHDLKVNSGKINTSIYKVIGSFFKASEKLSQSKWDNKFYLTNQYISSFTILFDSIFEHLISVSNELKTAKDLEKCETLFSKYLKPAQEYIDEKSEIEISEFKKGKLGAGGPIGIFYELIGKINQVYPNFEKNLVETKIELSRFEELFEEIEPAGDETEILEVKESFFYNTERDDKGKLVKNDEMTLKIIKTIVAMANGEGGDILIGIRDPKNNKPDNIWKIVGLGETDLAKQSKYFETGPNNEKYKKAIQDKISSEVDKEIRKKIKISIFQPIRGKDCVLITIGKLEYNRLSPEFIPYLVDDLPYQRINDETTKIKTLHLIPYGKSMLDKLYPK